MPCPRGKAYGRAMRDREPTIRSRELGEGLRHAMREAGFNANQIARQLEWSPSRVSRLLSGKRGGSTLDVSTFLFVCGVRGEEREHLMALALDHNRPGWHQQHGARLPKQLRTLIEHENKAIAIKQFEFNLIPGLLQTGDYARALIEEAGMHPPDEITDRVAARLGRQNLLSRRNPPKCVFYIHEFALRLPVGGPEVMSEQLHTLLRLSVRPSITLRVVPAARGAHAAINGSFQFLEFRQIKPVVYLESETSSLFLELPIEINAYGDILAALDETALPEGQSKDLIGALAVELYGGHVELAEK
jgi:transcriptional regulator with XRE-family HTH domain